MRRARRRHESLPVGILFVAAIAVTLLAPAALATGLRSSAGQLRAAGQAAGPTPNATGCSHESPATISRAGLEPFDPGSANVSSVAVLDDAGELTGQSLEFDDASSKSVTIALPAESSVSAPVGELLVYTRHTPETGSQVRAVNLRTGCDGLLASPPEIVRSAILDASATGVYVHSVTRADRSDFGVQRYDLGSGAVTAIVPPFVATPEFGPVFGTQLRRSMDGDALAVQSCGFAECITRVRDHAAGTVTSFDFGDQGEIIGLTRARLVTYAGCHGLPCAVLSVDLTTGGTTTLVDEAFEATLVHAGAGQGRLQVQTAAGVVEFDQ